jgi:hypothetical protein
MLYSILCKKTKEIVDTNIEQRAKKKNEWRKRITPTQSNHESNVSRQTVMTSTGEKSAICVVLFLFFTTKKASKHRNNTAPSCTFSLDLAG